MRALVSEILARRMPEPPAEFVALQVSRLNEALLVAYSAMSGANLRAVDRVVKIVRELDRYHGFSPAHRRVLPDAPRLEDRLALDARPANRPEAAPQVFEKAAPGIGAAPAALQPQDAVPAQEAAALDPPLTKRPESNCSPCGGEGGVEGSGERVADGLEGADRLSAPGFDDGSDIGVLPCAPLGAESVGDFSVGGAGA
jgi:hypothetical protein